MQYSEANCEVRNVNLVCRAVNKARRRRRLEIRISNCSFGIDAAASGCRTRHREILTPSVTLTILAGSRDSE